MSKTEIHKANSKFKEEEKYLGVRLSTVFKRKALDAFLKSDKIKEAWKAFLFILRAIDIYDRFLG